MIKGSIQYRQSVLVLLISINISMKQFSFEDKLTLPFKFQKLASFEAVDLVRKI